VKKQAVRFAADGLGCLTLNFKSSYETINRNYIMITMAKIMLACAKVHHNRKIFHKNSYL